ncbi:MAG: hypothetical protein MR867_08705 [Eubacterium sp.]|nr:hypothetical protein [Eubacterium sp.]MDY5498193.1 hypothetical protein [Anaerobutyricum sp.]
MIDPRKVRLMTKLALYEEGEGRKDLKINRYKKRTYVGVKQLESIVLVTVAYALAVLLYFIGISADLFSKAVLLPVKKYLFVVTVLYIIIMIFNIIFVRAHYSRIYDQMRKNIREYDHMLYTLGSYMQKEKEDGK